MPSNGARAAISNTEQLYSIVQWQDREHVQAQRSFQASGTW